MILACEEMGGGGGSMAEGGVDADVRLLRRFTCSLAGW